MLFPEDGLYSSERLSPLIVTENIGREADDDDVLLTEFQSLLLTLSEWNSILFRLSQYYK